MISAAPKIQLIMELRRLGISDLAILSAIESVPREEFIEDRYRGEAYCNAPLPIAHGQTISQPYIVAYMTQELKLHDRCVVFEVGTGSGYQAAVLSRLCRRVVTIERFRGLKEQAEQRFDALGLENITVILGDGMKGWPDLAPFERIMVTAAAREVPAELLGQLADGGIMIIPVGGADFQVLTRITRTDDAFEYERLLDVRFVPLLPGLARSHEH
jgi:protein-L-isoaspartate(D-aspartate) O-methyltransferase